MGFLDIFKSKKSSSDELTIVNREMEDSHFSEISVLPIDLSSKEVQAINSLQNLGEMGNKICEAYKESKRINANIKMLRMQTMAEVMMHAKEIELKRDIITKVYGERAVVLRKHYEVLERGLQKNDRELILASLQGISSIIVSNPLEQIAEYTKMLTSKNSKLLLDF